MPSSWRILIATALGLCLTIILPIVAALTVSQRQALEAENRFVLTLAHSALARAELTARQLARAYRVMQPLDTAAACSDAGLELMRELDLSSTLLQAVGWIEDDRMVCSSFGGQREYLLGPPDYRSLNGSIFRRNVTLDAGGQSYVVVQAGSSAVIIHKDLALSFVEDIPGAAVAVISWSTKLPVLQRGAVPASLITDNYQGETILRRDGATVGVVRSKDFDLGAIVVVPSAQTADFARRTAWVMVPIGLASALLLSGLFLQLMRTRSSMRGMIRTGLDQGQFELAYQPLIDLETKGVLGVEALLRWNRGRRLPIAPDVFIPVAEEAGLIGELTRRVFEILGREAPAIVEHLPEAHFAVNFSASDLTRRELVGELEHWSSQAGVPLDHLIAEATERALIDVEKAAGQFERLRAAGIRIAIDDFGTGYSNLAYLTTLEVDYLKIDRLFVQALGTSAATNQVASGIVTMARQLGLQIVAEGIETEAQAEQVHALGCDSAQGYYYARPMPAAELCRWLEERAAQNA